MFVLLSRPYLAGIFDSDGAFTISHHRRKGSRKGYEYRVLLQITWRRIPETKGVLDDLKAAYGGSVTWGTETSGHSRHTRYVKYRVGSRQAKLLIQDILPYLRIKRRQAEICLQAASIISRHHRGRWNPRPGEEWKELERLYRLNAFLNWSKGKGRRKRIPAIVNYT